MAFNELSRKSGRHSLMDTKRSAVVSKILSCVSFWALCTRQGSTEEKRNTYIGDHGLSGSAGGNTKESKL